MKNYKVDPRSKLVIILVLSSLALIYDDVIILLLILFVSFLISILMKSNLTDVVFKLKKIIILMFSIAVVQSLFVKIGNPILKLGSITIITDYGIIKALEFILRISIIIVSATILATSTSREIVQGLVQWKCPYEIAFMVSIAIRFLPIFKEEMTDMVVAIQLRGIDFKKIKFRQKIEVYRYIMLPIVTNSILKARDLSSSMEMRAFRAYSTRTSYMVLKMRKFDYIIISLSFVAMLLLIIMNYW